MASIFLRSSILRGSAFRRLPSAATVAAPLVGEGLAARQTVPLRRLFSSGADGDQPPKYLDEEKVDQMQKEVDELNQLIEEDITELLKMYKEYQSADHGYLESFLTRCGMAKSKSRDNFIWGCEVTTLFALSAGVGYLLARVEMS